MEVDEILDALRYYRGSYPREAMDDEVNLTGRWACFNEDGPWLP